MEEAQLAEDIISYSARNGFFGVKREFPVDSFSCLRTDYFISVLKSSHNSNDFEKLLEEIPSGRPAHQRFLGRPEIFSEPPGTEYPPNLPFLASVGLKVKAEIMLQVFYSLSTKEKISEEDFVERALEGFRKDFGTDFMLASYKKSRDHNFILRNYSKNKMGVCVKAIFAETWDQTRLRWKYETVIYNVVLFTE